MRGLCVRCVQHTAVQSNPDQCVLFTPAVVFMTQWFFDNKCSRKFALWFLKQQFRKQWRFGRRFTSRVYYFRISNRIFLILLHLPLLVLFPSAPIEVECTHRRNPSMMKYVILLRFIRIVLFEWYWWHSHESISLAHYTSFCRDIHLSICGRSIGRPSGWFFIISWSFYRNETATMSDESGRQRTQLIANCVHSDYVSLHWLAPSFCHLWRVCSHRPQLPPVSGIVFRGEDIFVVFTRFIRPDFLWTKNAMIPSNCRSNFGENYRKEEQQCS